MVRARRQYHHNNHHRHALNHIYRHKRFNNVPSAPSNTTQFIMNDHESIEPDFDLMHNAIMEHYNRNKKRKHQHVTTTSSSNNTPQQSTLSPSASRNQKQRHSPLHHQQQPHHLQESTTTTAASTNAAVAAATTTKSNPTTPSHRPTGSPGDEDGMSPFINHEHLQSEFQEVYANIHTERLSSMSKNQIVRKYLLLEERVEELENQLRKSQTSASLG